MLNVTQRTSYVDEKKLHIHIDPQHLLSFLYSRNTYMYDGRYGDTCPMNDFCEQELDILLDFDFDTARQIYTGETYTFTAWVGDFQKQLCVPNITAYQAAKILEEMSIYDNVEVQNA